MKMNPWDKICEVKRKSECFLHYRVSTVQKMWGNYS